jgi:virulence-associated protein VapD
MEPLTMMAISAGVQGLGSLISGIGARRAERAARRKERDSRREMRRLKDVYANLDTSNPYLNMENVYEDLTVNQQQAQFQRQQGQIAAQQSSATIGMQEAANQRMRQQEAARLQSLERQGDLISRAQEREQVGTLLGMSQAEAAAYGQARAQATQAKFDAISSGVTGIANIGIAGLQAGAFSGGPTTFGDIPHLRQDQITLGSRDPLAEYNAKQNNIQLPPRR